MIVLAFALALAAAPPQHGHDYALTAPPQTTSKTFTLGATPGIGVDNLNGDITVVGDGGAEARFTAVERVRAENQDALARAQRDVHLEVTPTANSLELYVDGPFRCGNSDYHGTANCGHWDFWDRHDPGYEVEFSFELHVPAGSQVSLHSVNGDVHVTAVAGRFTVRTVNGNLDLEQVRDEGSASTVNGSVKAVFRDNPHGDCSFTTVNGRVSLYLRPDLNATVRYSTVSGAIYTDFPSAEAVADSSFSGSRGMRVWRSGRSHTVQIGQGGPQIKVRTVNGDVFLHRGQ